MSNATRPPHPNGDAAVHTGELDTQRAALRAHLSCHSGGWLYLVGDSGSGRLALLTTLLGEPAISERLDGVWWLERGRGDPWRHAVTANWKATNDNPALTANGLPHWSSRRLVVVFGAHNNPQDFDQALARVIPPEVKVVAFRDPAPTSSDNRAGVHFPGGTAAAPLAPPFAALSLFEESFTAAEAAALCGVPDDAFGALLASGALRTHADGGWSLARSVRGVTRQALRKDPHLASLVTTYVTLLDARLLHDTQAGSKASTVTLPEVVNAWAWLHDSAALDAWLTISRNVRTWARHHGFLEPLRCWTEALVDLAERQPGVRGVVRLNLQFQLAQTEAHLGRSSALNRAQDGLSRLPEGDPLELDGMVALATAYFSLNRMRDAAAAFARAVALARRHGAREQRIAALLGDVAQSRLLAGDAADTEAPQREAIEIFQRLQMPAMTFSHANGLAMTLMALHRHHEAFETLQHAIQGCHRYQQRDILPNLHHSMAQVRLLQRDATGAHEALLEAYSSWPTSKGNAGEGLLNITGVRIAIRAAATDATRIRRALTPALAGPSHPYFWYAGLAVAEWTLWHDQRSEHAADLFEAVIRAPAEAHVRAMAREGLAHARGVALAALPEKTAARAPGSGQILMMTNMHALVQSLSARTA